MRARFSLVTVALGLITLLAVVTGFYGLRNQGILSWDEGVYYDEARFCALTSQAVGQWLAGRFNSTAPGPELAELKSQVTGLPPRMGRPLNCLLNTTGLLILGNHQWVPALISALAGVGCVLALFALARRLFDESVALLAALLLTLSPYFLPYRRLGMCEAPATLLTLLTLLLLLRQATSTLTRRWAWYSLASGLMAGLAFGLNTRTLTLLPVVLLWQVSFIYRQTRAVRQRDAAPSPGLTTPPATSSPLDALPPPVTSPPPGAPARLPAHDMGDSSLTNGRLATGGDVVDGVFAADGSASHDAVNVSDSLSAAELSPCDLPDSTRAAAARSAADSAAAEAGCDATGGLSMTTASQPPVPGGSPPASPEGRLSPVGAALAAGLLVLTGFGLMVGLYQLPYLLVAPLQAKAGVELTSYFAQLRHFAVTQRAIGGVGLPLAYGGSAFFVLFYEGPGAVLMLLGLLACLRRPSFGGWFLLSWFALPLLQTALLIPYARFLSWLLPLLSLLAAVGLRYWALGWSWCRPEPTSAASASTLALPCEAVVSPDRRAKAERGGGGDGARPDGDGVNEGVRARRRAVVTVAVLVGVVIWCAPALRATMGSVSQMPAALQGAWRLGVQQVVTTNCSLAYASAPLYDLHQLTQLAITPDRAAEQLQAACQQGLTVVILDPQQHVAAAELMSVSHYEASAAALIRRHCQPLWEAPQATGLFASLCFEHNRDIRESWRVYRTYRERSTTLAVYDGRQAWQALCDSLPPAYGWASP